MFTTRRLVTGAALLTSTLLVAAGCTTGGAGAPPELTPPNKTRITNGNGTSWNRSRHIMSADGRFLVFDSLATDLVAGVDPNGADTDVFLFDRVAGTTTRLSNSPETSERAQISSNGAYIVWEQRTQTTSKEIRYTVATGTTEELNNSQDASVANDGTVAFATGAALVPADTNNFNDVYTIDLAGVPTLHTQGNGNAREVAISGDGSTMAVYSEATNLTADVDNNGSGGDIFLIDTATDIVTRVSNSSQTNFEGPGGSSLSDDGQYLVFDGMQTDLVAAPDPNGSGFDVFLYSRSSSSTVRITSGNDISGYPVISANGNYVALVSAASNLTVGPDANAGGIDSFIWQRSNAMFTRMTNGNSLAPDFSGNNDAIAGASGISNDGRWVTFSSSATNLTAGVDNNGSRLDIFLIDRA